MDGHEGMVYQDEDGNLIMYNHDGMGDDEEEDGMGGDEYGMEGSPGVRLKVVITAADAVRIRKSTSKKIRHFRACLHWIK